MCLLTSRFAIDSIFSLLSLTLNIDFKMFLICLFFWVTNSKNFLLTYLLVKLVSIFLPFPNSFPFFLYPRPHTLLSPILLHPSPLLIPFVCVCVQKTVGDDLVKHSGKQLTLSVACSSSDRLKSPPNCEMGDFRGTPELHYNKSLTLDCLESEFEEKK